MTQSGVSITHRAAVLIIFGSLVCGWVLFFDLNFSSDPERYYAYLRSAFFDGDINFYNEYTIYSFIQSPQKSLFLVKTGTGYLWNPFSIGPAVLWLPFFLGGHIFAVLLAFLGYPILVNGYSFPYLFGAALGTFFYSFCGLVAVYFLSVRYCSRFASLFSIMLLFWSSPLPAYFMREPGYAHSMSFCCISLFLLSWVLFHENDLLMRHYYPFVFLGCLGGLTCLVRWQNCLILVFPFLALFVMLYRRKMVTGHSFLHLFSSGIIMSCVFVFVMFPQLLSWKILYSDFLTVPQGDNFMHWTDPQLYQVLFSPLNGLFSWHPAMFIGLLSLVFFLRKQPLLMSSGLLFFIFQWYVNGSVDDWFAGAAFGNRRFINCLPFFMVGLSFLFDRILRARQKWWTIFFLLLPLWNLILFLRSYGGDLMGLKSLRMSNVFFEWHHWSILLLNFMHTNFFFRELMNSAEWPIPWVRFLFPFVVLGLLAVIYFLGKKVIGRLNTIIERGRERSIVFISGAVLVFFSLLSLFLIYSGVTAKTIFPVHLGEDAFGKIEYMKIGDVGSYMGSRTPVHLAPGQTVTIPCEPPGLYREIEIIATLSGHGVPQLHVMPIMQVTLGGMSGKKSVLQFHYPSDIDRMDRDEYRRFGGENEEGSIRYSWFYPTLQKKPHHWYGVRKRIEEDLIITGITVENLSPSLELHLTGLAFLE